jgi:hypothetical protein
MSEDEAKKAWLETQMTPSWGSEVAEFMPAAASPLKMSEKEAKKAWLARLDAPTWGKAAKALVSVASEAAQIAEMTAACDVGDDVACDFLSREEEAKRAWMAKVDAPTWSAAAAAVSAVATEVTEPVGVTEEEAKRAWLARLDTPSWGTTSIPAPARMSEERATTAWDIKLDSATWAKVAATLTSRVAESAQLAGICTACDSGDDVACNTLSDEVEAKRAWLTNLDVPAWGAAAAAVSVVASRTSAGSSQSAIGIARQEFATSI